MEMETTTTGPKFLPQTKYSCGCTSTKLLLYLSILLPLLIIFHFQASPFTSLSSFPWPFFHHCNPNHYSHSKLVGTLTAKLRDSVTFLPLKDLRFEETAMIGNTWFMSSLNDTYEENEPQYLYFPSDSSKGRILCMKGRHTSDSTKNSYALAWPEALPPDATLMEGLTFVLQLRELMAWIGSDRPFCQLVHEEQLRKAIKMGTVPLGGAQDQNSIMGLEPDESEIGDVEIESFGSGGSDVPYCFEKAVVMKHDLGRMGKEKKLRVFDLLRCKSREACGVSPPGRGGREVNNRGVPIIRLTLLMRRGSRSFKNGKVVKGIVGKECGRVKGCVLDVVQSEDLCFCDQVRVMTNTDIVASPHGAQLTNILFMDRGSSMMEFFPKGWLQHAGVGQYVYHWMANQSGMKHQGTWWDPIGDECPYPPNQELECFLFHKDGKVGHNETYFAQWARKVLNQVEVEQDGAASFQD